MIYDANYTHYGRFSNKRFLDVFPDAETFKKEYSYYQILFNSPIKVEENQMGFIYYILYSKYGSEYIAMSNTTRFESKLFATLELAAPMLLKELDVQKNLLALSDEEIRAGSKAVYNHAFNPSGTPSTSTLQEIPYINDQNTTQYKKSPMEGYSILLSLLDDNLLENFLRKFKKLFLRVLAPTRARLYDVEELEENINSLKEDKQ